MSYDTKPASTLTAEAAQMLVVRGWWLATAESCTGGNLAAALCTQTDTVAFYDTGVATFSDEAKRNVLRVRVETLEVYSAVSEACAQEMSVGILAMTDAGIAIAINGYMGPEGGEGGIPVDMVWLAWNLRGQTETKWMCFAGDCETVAARAVRYALTVLSEKLVHWQ